MTKEQKKHYDRVARLGCAICRKLGYDTQDVGCEIHHIRRAGQRKTAPVVGLCFEHHRGNTGVHGMGRKNFERKYGTTEEELLEKTLELLNDRPQQK